ncbi:LLM class flavin-dependent oxidoreductase [Nocardia sp. NEAU-G5]|uniref:LLM class flavin-dependent oxidoreductase n=1 Tax=Nocardia albiluteola TaxID=2842303 RepID=A0ABS6B9K8_9NOCA|nr:LLM class flavin-dependent oxidoreductase [Nocardia albiluteola]MBU3065864.1 LLM class flavin-dependent oxidoreductase [Nocardia albiluteola]
MFDTRFGLLIPQRGAEFGVGTLGELLELGPLAEQSPLLSSVWVGDSLTAQPRADSLTLLGALSALTSRVRLGTACMASFPVRDPAVLAYQWASLDRVSGGRMVLGACTGLVGDGVSAAEGEHWGVPDRERGPRLAENIRLCRELWSGKEIDFEGRFRSYRGLAVHPVPVQDPCPVFIAANPWNPAFAERALRRVATLADGWMTAASWPGLFETLWDGLSAQLAEVGRDPAQFPVTVLYNINVGAGRKESLAETARFIRAHENGEDVPAPMVEAWTAAGPPAACATALRTLIEQGATHVILRITAWDQRAQLDRVVNEVLPLV